MKRGVVIAASFATVMIAIPLLYDAFMPLQKRHWLVEDLITLFLAPGNVAAALIAMIISPQGVHGIDSFMWLGAPVSWAFYLLLVMWVRCRLMPQPLPQRKGTGRSTTSR